MNPRSDKHTEPTDATSATGGLTGADDLAAQNPDAELAVNEKSPSDPAYSVPEGAKVDVSGGGLGSIWALVALGAVLLILLLVFVLQNQDNVEIEFLPWSFSMPSGVIILLAAIVGALVMALAAAFRIFQLRHRARRSAKALRMGGRSKR
ncbi:LapA family protein [Dietzia sp.]|uniref:LapA family protein n=1 Tax=Dietzia sp. TaxID=1871616 RepID=UPI002FD8D086